MLNDVLGWFVLFPIICYAKYAIGALAWLLLIWLIKAPLTQEVQLFPDDKRFQLGFEFDYSHCPVRASLNYVSGRIDLNDVKSKKEAFSLVNEFYDYYSPEEKKLREIASQKRIQCEKEEEKRAKGWSFTI